MTAGSAARRVVRCAIYTRKSTEEGLDMAFNSLEAQREACEAYIQSQRHEGWKLLPAEYNDGGFSGGSMERPAVKRLMADIDAGRVDTVVVYKVDRLTRSLADFAKMVEVFDAKGISFISVTQQFNTTTSMGRLTLNVLLSFAQFEREVTGERIRDKIAASKRKGMWMGGPVPLGYRLGNRKLLVDDGEADQVRRIFDRYLVLKSVQALKSELDKAGVSSKRRLSRRGKSSGGLSFSRGALYTLLRNPLYVGEVRHRQQCFPGQQPPIVTRRVWDEVQALLHANKHAQTTGAGVREPSLLAGLVFDENGQRLTPSHTNKAGKRYRYYAGRARDVSPAIEGDRRGRPLVRVPAHDLEMLVTQQIQRFLALPGKLLDVLFDADSTESGTAEERRAVLSAAQQHVSGWGALPLVSQRSFLQQCLRRVVVREESIELTLTKSSARNALWASVSHRQDEVEPSQAGASDSCDASDDLLVISIEARIRRCGKELRLIVPADSADEAIPRRPAAALVNTIALAQLWYQRLTSGAAKSQQEIATEVGREHAYVSRVVQCAFLAPDIVESILGGAQPPDLTLEKLLSGLPMGWNDQRALLGFPAMRD